MYGDEFMLALCIWREARGDGEEAMTAVGAVVRNRVVKASSSYYHEVTKPWQFSSITAKGDPELGLYPQPTNTADWDAWQQAQSIAQGVMNGSIADPTNGAEFYYAITIPLPSWGVDMTMTAQIGRQRFYKQ